MMVDTEEIFLDAAAEHMRHGGRLVVFSDCGLEIGAVIRDFTWRGVLINKPFYVARKITREQFEFDSIRFSDTPPDYKPSPRMFYYEVTTD